jgi:hypothetical protein
MVVTQVASSESAQLGEDRHVRVRHFPTEEEKVRSSLRKATAALGCGHFTGVHPVVHCTRGPHVTELSTPHRDELGEYLSAVQVGFSAQTPSFFHSLFGCVSSVLLLCVVVFFLVACVCFFLFFFFLLLFLLTLCVCVRVLFLCLCLCVHVVLCCCDHRNVRALWCVNRYSLWQFDEDDAEHSPLIWTNMNKIVYHASCQQPQFRLSSRDPASDDWFYVFPHRFLIVDQLQGWLGCS